jgi:hypothetical protein
MSFWKKGKRAVAMKRKQGAEMALPVFSVDTEEQARALFTRFGRLERTGSGRHRFTDFSGEVEDLAQVTRLMRDFYRRIA